MSDEDFEYEPIGPHNMPENRREEWSKVRDLLSAAMLMVNAWDSMGCPQDATRKRMQDALKEFGK